jgi:hypothetical protein
MQQQHLIDCQKGLDEVSGGSGGADDDGGASLTPPGSPLSPSDDSCQPLSLIVQKPASNTGELLDAFRHN